MRALGSLRSFLGWIAVPLAVASSESALAQTTITVPNNPGDDTAALRQAFHDAQFVYGGNVIIKLLKGQYDFDLVANPPPYGGSQPGGFQLDHLNGITIRGTGSEFLNGVAYPGTKLTFNGFDPQAAPGSTNAYPRSIFKFLEVNGLTMTNMRILMSREPYSTGKVVAKHPSLPYSVDLVMDPAYGDLLSGFQIERIDDFDYSSKQLMGKNFSVQLDYKATNPDYTATVIGPGQVRITSNLTSPTAWLNQCIAAVPDDYSRGLVLMHSKHLIPFAVASKCSDVVLDHILINDMGGSALVGWSCDDITVDDVDIQPRNDRLMSLTSDGFHLQDCTGVIDVQDCEIRATGDDGLNVFSKVLEVTSVSGTTVTFHQPPSAYFELEWNVGEEVQFLQPDLIKRTPTSILSSFTLNTPPPSNYLDRTYTATFTTAPVCQVGDWATDLDNRPDSVLIARCTVEDNIARGLCIHVPNATVSDCTFRRNTAPAILVETEVMFYDEVAPGNEPGNQIVIEGCTIDDSNRTSGLYLGALTVVGLYGSTSNPITSAPGLYHNVFLRNNVFRNLSEGLTFPRARRAAVWMASSDFVTFESNTFWNIASNVSIVRLENTTHAYTDGQNNMTGYTGSPAFELVGIYSFYPPPFTPPPGYW